MFCTYKEYERGYDAVGYDYQVNEVKYENAWRTIYTITQNTGWGPQATTSRNIGERAYQQFGANVVLGTDFYIVKHLYLGVELGLGYTSKTFKEVRTDSKYSEDDVIYPEAKTTELGLNVNSAIRLGFWF